MTYARADDVRGGGEQHQRRARPEAEPISGRHEAAGVGVVGGKVYGRWPGLAPAALDDGDLAGTTDYRTVLAEVLEKRGRLVVSSVFPNLPAARLGALKPRS